jgi:two-component system, NarL family, response regulator NreC
MDGMQIAEALSKQNAPFRVIMLTMQRGGRYIDRLKKWGVKGYVLKSVSLETLVDVIQRVHAGEEHFPEDAREFDHNEDVRLKSSAILANTPGQQLTAREQEILVLVCKEFSSKEIGEKLFISTGTVDTHRKNLLLKLGVTNTVGLVKYALKHNLLDD